MLDILKLQRHTQRYEYADGVRDLQSALWMLMIGLMLWLVWDHPLVWKPSLDALIHTLGQSVATVIVLVVAIGVPVLIMQGSLWLMNETLRRRWLWRDTGMITPKAWIVPRSVIFSGFAFIIMASIIGILLAGLLSDLSIIFRALTIGTGTAMVYQYAVMSRRLDLIRYQRVALVGMIGTVVISLLPLTVGLLGLVVCLFWTATLIFSGLSALRMTAEAMQGVVNER